MMCFQQICSIARGWQRAHTKLTKQSCHAGVFLGLMVGLSPLRNFMGKWMKARQYRDLHSPHALTLNGQADRD